jgi:hypothetical protein
MLKQRDHSLRSSSIISPPAAGVTGVRCRRPFRRDGDADHNGHTPTPGCMRANVTLNEIEEPS